MKSENIVDRVCVQLPLKGTGLTDNVHISHKQNQIYAMKENQIFLYS